ncbi:MAG TPA: YbbR-like domain-containing protein [Candidatus Kapabacteria bacterium]|nr:YbbR-like domain-containing protein [Candidatus Kapabacteria bacterium]
MGFSRRLGIALTALLVAALLWTYVHLSTPYEAEIDIPVSITPPKGLAIASGLPERLHARVKGAGWKILLLEFTGNAKFELDLTERLFPLTNPNTLQLTPDELRNGARLPSEVELVVVEPDTLDVSFGRIVRKQVPVRPVMNVTPGRGYALVGVPVATPPMVTIEGSQDVLDSIQFFPTKPLDRSSARETVSESVELLDTLSNSVRVLSASLVRVRQSVQAIGERTFTYVPVHPDAAPVDKDILFVPGYVSVTLRGGVEDLAKMKSDDIRAYVMYDPIKFDSAEYVTPSVSTPQGISFLSSKPSSLRFVVRRKAVTSPLKQPNARP